MRTERKQKEQIKKAQGMLGVNYCFVKYSEVEDLRQKLNDASIALSQAAKSLVSIGWMSTARMDNVASYAKSTDISDTNRNTLLPNRDLEPDAFGINMVKKSKFIDSHSTGLPTGQTKKSRKK